MSSLWLDVFRSGTLANRPVIALNANTPELYYATDEGVMYSRVGGQWEAVSGVTGVTANGLFVRYPDGTQLCLHRQTSSTVGAEMWTYPAAFVASPRVVNCQPLNIAARIGSIAPPASATNFNFSSWATDGVRQANECSLLAIGRWR